MFLFYTSIIFPFTKILRVKLINDKLYYIFLLLIFNSSKKQLFIFFFWWKILTFRFTDLYCWYFWWHYFFWLAFCCSSTKFQQEELLRTIKNFHTNSKIIKIEKFWLKSLKLKNFDFMYSEHWNKGYFI